ncbi:hypothetical protein AAFP30_04655 [Gordonia sp. CPCC 205515]|uniref:hypothetical protein n=1 Tax=Gordonia sp. CPCC 205515 TaxID=3140791 RepID=UPI003AF3A334
MPRRSEFTDQYGDALRVLTVASGRPAAVVNLDGRYGLRVDFEFSRYALATNTADAVGLVDRDAETPWRVQVFADRDRCAVLLADATADWLIDAYESAMQKAAAS